MSLFACKACSVVPSSPRSSKAAKRIHGRVVHLYLHLACIALSRPIWQLTAQLGSEEQHAAKQYTTQRFPHVHAP